MDKNQLIQKLRWDFAVAQTLQVPMLKQSSCFSLTWHRCLHALCSLSNQPLTSIGNLYLMGLKVVKAYISEFEYDVIIEFIPFFSTKNFYLFLPLCVAL